MDSGVVVGVLVRQLELVDEAPAPASRPAPCCGRSGGRGRPRGARAWRPGESSQQPTWPHAVQMRRWTQGPRAAGTRGSRARSAARDAPTPRAGTRRARGRTARCGRCRSWGRGGRREQRLPLVAAQHRVGQPLGARPTTGDDRVGPRPRQLGGRVVVLGAHDDRDVARRRPDERGDAGGRLGVVVGDHHHAGPVQAHLLERLPAHPVAEEHGRRRCRRRGRPPPGSGSRSRTGSRPRAARGRACAPQARSRRRSRGRSARRRRRRGPRRTPPRRPPRPAVTRRADGACRRPGSRARRSPASRP